MTTPPDQVGECDLASKANDVATESATPLGSKTFDRSKWRRRDQSLVTSSEAPRILRFTVGEWLSIGQLVALIVGAGFAGYTYYRFERDDKLRAEAKATATPLKINQDIKVRRYDLDPKIRPKRYGVDLHYAIENQTGQRIEIFQVVTRALLLPHQSQTHDGLIEIPHPGTYTGSPWKQEVARASVSNAGSRSSGSLTLPTKERLPIGADLGAAGPLEPGEVASSSVSVIVRGTDADYVGFVLEVSIRFSDGAVRTVDFDGYAPLVVNDGRPT